MTSSRLVSLDAFRGFTIASMVLVNNPGDWDHVYPQLDHAAWNGWTFTDLIFPFFLFISGVALSLSIARRRAGALADERRQLLFSLWQRAAIIFLIGLALNFVPNFDLATLRIPGVLQRIALCTALAAPLVLYCNWRALFGWLVGLLAFYAAAMLLVPVPDPSGVVVAGALEPGRDLGAFIDRLLLSGHLWAKSRTWDPEGLFSTLPALATMLGGVLTGHWLARDLGDDRRLARALLSRATELLWRNQHEAARTILAELARLTRAYIAALRANGKVKINNDILQKKQQQP